MIESEGRFYVYSTGGGSKSSADGLAWTNGPALFPSGIPSSTTSVVSSNEGVWAPDVIFLNGQYYLYYSIANAQDACAIGLVTSPTLNPSSSSYKWTDHGLVVSNTGSATYCTIDPAPLLDESGNLWLAWGSGYSHASTDNTLFVTRLDNTTGLKSSADSANPGHALEQGHIEASYIYFHSGYYYLFWNSGGCCDGASSSYLIHVARSQSVTGPYAGTKNFYGSTGSIHGPGHIGIYDECGASRFTYHYYPDTGGSVLGENELSWGSDGFPVVGAESTTPLEACASSGNGGAGNAGGAGGSADANAGSAGLGGDSSSTGGANASAQGGAAGSSVVAGGFDAGSLPSSGAGAGGAASAAAGGPSQSNSGGDTALGGQPSGNRESASGSASGCSCRAQGATGSLPLAPGFVVLGALLAGIRRRRRARKLV